MKLFHLADLHFGKTIYGLSMLEDQRYWTDRFLELCDDERPDAVLIAGDVYDRAAPAGEAVALLDLLLTGLIRRDIPVFMIAGNHDSGRRLSFAREMLARQNLHIAGTISAEITHVTFEDPDGFGPVTFWLLPYLYPEAVSAVLRGETDEDVQIKTYDEAMRALLARQDIDPAHRNIILSHQNVTVGGAEAERGGSESMVGGVGQIDWSAYDAFDYAALGHIHAGYAAGRNEVRYAGTPLCYHFNETRQGQKGPVEVLLGARGEPVRTRTIGIEPLHKMRALEGSRDEIYRQLESELNENEYIGITLTDERITPQTAAYLRQLLESRGSLLLELRSTYSDFQNRAAAAQREAVEARPLEDLFQDLYTEQTGGRPPSDDEYAVMREAGELVRRRDADLPLDEKDVERILEFARKIGGERE